MFLQACKCGFCVLVVSFCIFFLIIATTENLKHGPETVHLSLHLSSLTFKKIKVDVVDYKRFSQNLDADWNAGVVISDKRGVVNITVTTTGSNAYIKYKAQSISCGRFVNNNIHSGGGGGGGRKETWFESEHCDVPYRLDKGSAGDLGADLNRKKVILTFYFAVRCLFKHGMWAWDNVYIFSSCDDLLVEFDEKQRQWIYKGNGTDVCKVLKPPVSVDW